MSNATMKTFLIERVREHSSRGNFPANLVVEVTNVFDRTGPRDLPH
jgi:hypothetical protein